MGLFRSSSADQCIMTRTVVSVPTVLLKLPLSVLKCVWRQMSVPIMGRWSVITVTASFLAFLSLIQMYTLLHLPSFSATLKLCSVFQSAPFEQQYVLMFCPHSFISSDGICCSDYVVEGQVALSTNSVLSFEGIFSHIRWTDEETAAIFGTILPWRRNLEIH